MQARWNTKYEIESMNKICLENTKLGASQKGERLFQLFIITGLPLPQKGLPYRNLQMRYILCIFRDHKRAFSAERDGGEIESS